MDYARRRGAGLLSPRRPTGRARLLLDAQDVERLVGGLQGLGVLSAVVELLRLVEPGDRFLHLRVAGIHLGRRVATLLDHDGAVRGPGRSGRHAERSRNGQSYERPLPHRVTSPRGMTSERSLRSSSSAAASGRSRCSTITASARSRCSTITASARSPCSAIAASARSPAWKWSCSRWASLGVTFGTEASSATEASRTRRAEPSVLRRLVLIVGPTPGIVSSTDWMVRRVRSFL